MEQLGLGEQRARLAYPEVSEGTVLRNLLRGSMTVVSGSMKNTRNGTDGGCLGGGRCWGDAHRNRRQTGRSGPVSFLGLTAAL